MTWVNLRIRKARRNCPKGQKQQAAANWGIAFFLARPNAAPSRCPELGIISQIAGSLLSPPKKAAILNPDPLRRVGVIFFGALINE